MLIGFCYQADCVKTLFCGSDQVLREFSEVTNSICERSFQGRDARQCFGLVQLSALRRGFQAWERSNSAPTFALPPRLTSFWTREPLAQPTAQKSGAAAEKHWRWARDALQKTGTAIVVRWRNRVNCSAWVGGGEAPDVGGSWV